MGSRPSKQPAKKGNIPNNNQQEGSKNEDNETDSRQNDDSQARPRVNEKHKDESDHKAEAEAIPDHNGETRLKKEEDFQKQERKRLKSSVKNHMADIRKCKVDKLNSYQVINMSRRLQQFCIANKLVSYLKSYSCRQCYNLYAY